MSILLILVAVSCGGLAGVLAATYMRRGRMLVGALITLAAMAAGATNATKFLLDLDWPFDAVDAAEAAAYFVFGFSTAAAWALLKPSRLRWLLAVLVPVAMYEPLRWAIALVYLSLRRLGL